VLLFHSVFFRKDIDAMPFIRHIPNCITSLRIVGTAAWLFTEPLSRSFYILYFITGLTDVLDGFIARRLHITSEFGAKLDSVADMLFYTVMLSVMFPALWELLPVGIWYLLGAVLAVRLTSYAVAAIKFHRFASNHTWLNKITGAVVFAIPFVLLLPCDIPLCWAICITGGVASVEELMIHLLSREYNPNVKSILDINGGRFSERIISLANRSKEA